MLCTVFDIPVDTLELNTFKKTMRILSEMNKPAKKSFFDPHLLFKNRNGTNKRFCIQYIYCMYICNRNIIRWI